MKNSFLIALLLTGPLWAIGQNGDNFENFVRQINLNKKLARYADSVRLIGAAGILTRGLKSTTDSLDKLAPKGYYERASSSLDAGNYNDAAFLYYLGNLRYHYYNSTNANYSKGNDGALLASFNYVLGEPLMYYLKSYPDNYLEILKKSLNWYLTNDYSFWTNAKDPKSYADQGEKLSGFIEDLETNKSSYEAKWKKDREELDKALDNVLQQMNKGKK